ncbi:MAG TPA: sulfotransferase family 2 domain-containing protein [Oscillatoriaceae cyanobacterium M33_DOE_052]|uniref:Sulfotransferase family protein n=1 Tax=Planktothricoides sp. SpSt-374 TaxID=2282167 RepID=A0A7C3ZLU4_9CYAN|nr:sulfotransferase family 2 domain-containing protein [Oscillatoriaceae cyanobacterium M33_DOE_052]
MTNTGNPLIFVHIPKAAGTTLHQIIERQYPKHLTCTLDGTNPEAAIEQFKQLPEAQRMKIKVLKGHMPFGLHQFLSEPCTYITMLRDPVERVISHYYYVLRKPNHYLHEKITSQNMTLLDYVNSGISTELNNGQAILLSGIDKRSGNLAERSDEILEKSRQNLEQMAVVGIMEQFDETLILLQKTFGWKNIFYVKEKVTKNKPMKDSLSLETIQAIENQNYIDVKIYQHAQQLFAQQLSPIANLVEEVEQFQKMNQYYQTIGQPYQIVKKKIKALMRK